MFSFANNNFYELHPTYRIEKMQSE